MSGRRGGVTPLSKETMKSNSSPRCLTIYNYKLFLIL